MRIKKILFVVFPIVLLGCGAQNSDVAQDYQASLDLDSGAYRQVISDLNDCDGRSGNRWYECLLDLGAAYMALGGFSLIDFGKDILEIEDATNNADEISNEITRLIFNKLDDANVEKGVELMARILVDADVSSGTGRICTEAAFDSLHRLVQQACLATNPILLKSIMVAEGSGSSDSSDASMSLLDVISYQDIIETAVSGIEIEDTVRVINGEPPLDSSDKNENDILDGMEATSCVIIAYDNGSTPDLTVCANDQIEIELLSTDVFSSISSPSNLSDIHSLKVIVSDSANSTSNTFYPLAQEVLGSGEFSTLETEGYCYAADLSSDNSCSESQADGLTCVACPVISTSGVRTFNDSVEDVVNNEGTFNAVASLLASGDDDLTDAQKSDQLRQDMCRTDEAVTIDNPGECDVIDGEIYIPQNLVLEYFKAH